MMAKSNYHGTPNNSTSMSFVLLNTYAHSQFLSEYLLTYVQPPRSVSIPNTLPWIRKYPYYEQSCPFD